MRTTAILGSLYLCVSAACGGPANSDETGAASSSSGAASSSSGGDAPTTGDESSSSTGAPAPTTGDTVAGPGTSSGSESGSESTDGDGVIVVMGLSHPEAIVHDAIDDVYLIGNINGDPDAVDDNGFISRVAPDGAIEALHWIDGATAEVELDAPKGMVIVDDELLVADLTRVRRFDRVSGAPLGEVVIPDATFLNDLAADADGNVFVSDTINNTIHVIDGDEQVSVVIMSPDIAGPNGIWVHDGRLYIATYGDKQIFDVTLDVPVAESKVTLEVGELDGLARLSDGDWLVTSWEAAAVLRVSADFATVSTAVAGVSSPADIAVDEGRGRVLIPRLLEDSAEFHLY